MATPDGVIPISAITNDKEGDTVTISGKVASMRKIPGDNSPYIIRVTDPTGSIDVVFWKDLADQLTPQQKATVGDKIRATGKVNSHRGTLQLKLDGAEGLRTDKSHPGLFKDAKQTTGSQPQTKARTISAKELASTQLQERVTLSAHVAAVEPIRTGRRVTLEQDGAKATILLWDTAEGLKPEVHTLGVVRQSLGDGHGRRS